MYGHEAMDDPICVEISIDCVIIVANHPIMW